MSFSLCFLMLFIKQFVILSIFFFQAEDGIRDAQESRGLGDVYKRQVGHLVIDGKHRPAGDAEHHLHPFTQQTFPQDLRLSLIHI